jgi:hypothetical protein
MSIVNGEQIVFVAPVRPSTERATHPRVDVVAKGEAAVLVVAGGELAPVHEGQQPGGEDHGKGHGEEIGGGGGQDGVEALGLVVHVHRLEEHVQVRHGRPPAARLLKCPSMKGMP